MIHVAMEPIALADVAAALEQAGFRPAYDAPVTGSSKTSDWTRGADRVAFNSDLNSGLAFFVTLGRETDSLSALVQRIVPCRGVEEQIALDLEARGGGEQVRALFRLGELGRFVQLDRAISAEQITLGLIRGLESSEPFVYGAALEQALDAMWPELEAPVLALAARISELAWVSEYWTRIRGETDARAAKERDKAERQALRESLSSLVEEARWDEALSAAERALEHEDAPNAAFRALALAMHGLGRPWEAAFWTAVWLGKAQDDEAREALAARAAEVPREVPPLATLLRQAWDRVSDFEPLSVGLEALLERLTNHPRKAELEGFLAALAVGKSYDRTTQAAALPRIEALLEAAPGLTELWCLAAQARAAGDDLPGAEAAYRKALGLVGSVSPAEAEPLSKALTAIEDDPNRREKASIWSSLRWLYSSRSEYEALFRVANEQLEKATPHDPSALKDRGIAATFTQRHADAIRDYRAAIDAGYADEDGLCHFNLACELARQNRKQEALDVLRVAIELNDDAREKARTDDYFAPLWEDKDFRVLISGLESAPEAEEVERAISRSLGYQTRGDGEDAVNEAEYAVAGAELLGDDALRARAMRQLGQVLTFFVAPERGIRELERAANLGERVFAETPLERARTLHALGQAQHAAQRFDDARQSYEAALQLRRDSQGEIDFEVAITLGDLARLAGDRGDAEQCETFQERTAQTLLAVLETQSGDERLDTLLNLGLLAGNRASTALGRSAEESVEHAERAAAFLEELTEEGGRASSTVLLRLRRVVGEAAGLEPALVERALAVAHRLFVLEYPDPRVREHKLYWSGLRQAAMQLLDAGAEETEIAAAIARAVRGDEPGDPIGHHPAFGNLGVELSRRLTGATDIVMVAMSLDLASRGAQTVDEMLDNLEAFALSNIE